MKRPVYALIVFVLAWVGYVYSQTTGDAVQWNPDNTLTIAAGQTLDASAGTTTTGNLTVSGTFAVDPIDDPLWTFAPLTPGETAWTIGVNNDGVGDDNDDYEIRTSVTPGTGVVLLVRRSGGISTTTGIFTGNVEAGYFVSTWAKSGVYTIGADDVREPFGSVGYVNAAATITAAVVAAGQSFTVIVIGAVVVSVDPSGSDAMYLDGVLLANGFRATSPGTTGAMLVCTFHSAAVLYCASGSNDGTLWTDGGA